MCNVRIDVQGKHHWNGVETDTGCMQNWGREPQRLWPVVMVTDLFSVQ